MFQSNLMKRKWNKFHSLLVLLCSVISVFSLEGKTISLSDFKVNREVQQYNQHSSLQWNWAISSLDQYPFTGDESVLDIGSGDGKITAEITKRVPQGFVMGLDISEAMIHFASTHYPRSLYHNLFFLQSEATALPFHEQFDLIVSFCCLNWISDQQAVLAGIKKSLVPGGKALLVMPAKYPYNLSTVSEALSITDKWKKYFENKQVSVRYYFSAEEYKKFIQEVGLEPIQVNTVYVQDYFKNRQELVDWVLAISSFAKQLPEEKRLEFVEEVVEQMLTECPAPCADGTIWLRSPKLEVWLQKK